MSGCHVYRRMFPLINSYAMTIHKSQSLTLPCVFIDLGNEVFCSGMSYVALSRCQTYDGLFLLNFSPKRITASKKACIEYARLSGKTHTHVNTLVKVTCCERPWYLTFFQKQAASVTATDIKKEIKKRTASAVKATKQVPKKKKGFQNKIKETNL